VKRAVEYRFREGRTVVHALKLRLSYAQISRCILWRSKVHTVRTEGIVVVHKNRGLVCCQEGHTMLVVQLKSRHRFQGRSFSDFLWSLAQISRWVVGTVTRWVHAFIAVINCCCNL
jgi:hypothetical protein